MPKNYSISAKDFDPKKLQDSLTESQAVVVYYPDDGSPCLVFTCDRIFDRGDRGYTSFISNITTVDEWPGDDYFDNFKEVWEVNVECGDGIFGPDEEIVDWYAKKFHVKEVDKDLIMVDDITKYLLALTFEKCRCKNTPKAALEKLVSILPKEISERLVDYYIPSNSQYYGKVFLKVLNLKPEEQTVYKGKHITAIHIRPYKIEKSDKIMLSDRNAHPFNQVASYDEINVDYDKNTGNFHKAINMDSGKINFQVVLVADKYVGGKKDGKKVGSEGACPGIPEGVNIKSDEDLTGEFLMKVDEMGMYFPKISEAPSSDLLSTFKKMIDTVGIKLNLASGTK